MPDILGLPSPQRCSEALRYRHPDASRSGARLWPEASDAVWTWTLLVLPTQLSYSAVTLRRPSVDAGATRPFRTRHRGGESDHMSRRQCRWTFAAALLPSAPAFRLASIVRSPSTPRRRRHASSTGSLVTLRSRSFPPGWSRPACGWRLSCRSGRRRAGRRSGGRC